jgi:hypothetical protein
MILAAHQPNYLPWAGYFYKMARCDIFVFLDSVQYSRTSYTARCLIKGVDGKARWLSVPVRKKGRYFQSILDTEIDNATEWQQSHLRSLTVCYSRASHFAEHQRLHQLAYGENYGKLSLLNARLIRATAQELEIAPRFYSLSELGIDSRSSDLLVDLCLQLSADTYLSGPGGRKYLDQEKFKQAGIELRFITYQPRPYPQLWGDFIPGLSLSDMLYNCGLEAVKSDLRADA